MLHSEIRVLTPGVLNFRPIIRGSHPFHANIVLPNTPGNITYNDRLHTPGSTYYQYIVKDAPAVRSEPFITALSNYRKSVIFYLISYQMPNGALMPVVNTWDRVAEELFTSDNFGRQLRSNRSIRRLVDELLEDVDTYQEATKILYDYVSQNVLWDGYFSRFPEVGVSKALEEQTGNSADKAMLLTVMLQAAGIDAYPVLISTRQNGRVIWDAPRLSYFDHILVKVYFPDSHIVLDPVSRYIPYGVLHPASLNDGVGLVIEGRESSFVDLDIGVESAQMVNAIVRIDESGTAHTQMQMKFDGYEAINQRIAFQNPEEEESIDDYFRNEVLTGLTNVEIEGFRLLNEEDTTKPFEIRLLAKVPEYSNTLGDLIFVNPFVGSNRFGNPFRSEKRVFPVEFNYGIQRNYTASISVPDGYAVDEMPENAMVRFNDKNVLLIQYADLGSTVQVSSRLIRSELVIDALQYDDLREYYSTIENTVANQIVFKKATVDEQEPETDDTK